MITPVNVQKSVRGARALYRKHSRWLPIVAFVGGFGFDTLMLRRIDAPETLIQQAIYLLIAAALIGRELVDEARGTQHDSPLFKAAWLNKLWGYREGLLHFLLGTLLNSYTIFYFKSASAITSFSFVVILVGLLLVNEFVRIERVRAQVHVALLSLSLISYFVALAPILLGFIGTIPFACAVGASFGCFALFVRWIRPRLHAQTQNPEDPQILKKQVVRPFVGIHALFIALYFLNAIPPVPLSVVYMGIYHDVQKKDGTWQLTSTRPAWKFWQHGDQTFSARPGDVVNCYVQVFSPSRFKDDLQIRWLSYDAHRGWESTDAIPLAVTGGREEGYRGVTRKSHYDPGEWRVQVETRDGREVGRIHFKIEKDEAAPSEPRDSRTETR